MSITIPTTLIAIAFVLTLISGITGKVPLWIPVMLICVAFLAPR
jgi:hypothetical protein